MLMPTQGLPLYNASAVFVRTTMKTLYTDLSVQLKRITINSSSPSSPCPQDGGGGTVGEETQQGRSAAAETRHRREKSVFIALTVTGIARVSGSLGVWDVYVHPSSPFIFPLAYRRGNLFAVRQRTPSRRARHSSRTTRSTRYTQRRIRRCTRRSGASCFARPWRRASMA
jgi:hypothetical protein